MKTKLAFLSMIISFAISQCCNGCNPCTNPCASCSSGILIGNLLCVDGCPSTSTLSGSACSAPSGLLFSVDFTTQQSLTASSIGEFSTQSSTAFISPSKITPLPTLDRGFYFEGSSSLIDNNSYIPSYLFTLNIWIRPISPGTILSVSSGGTEYIRCETLSAGYQITSNFKNQAYSSLSPQNYQASGLLFQWQAVSFQIQQSDYTTINLSIIIDGSSNANSIIGFEANYPSANPYKWFIGNSGFASSFQGFLAFIEAWSDIVTTTSISGSFPNCVNNYYWDGSSCQTCLGCASSWPWCVRGTDCSYCASDDCSACTGYGSSMCTSCVGNGVAPNCCDSSCSTCSGLGYYSCSSCSSGSYLLRGICVPSCPAKYTQDSTQNKCIAISNLVVSLSLNDKIILDWISGAAFLIGSNGANDYPIFDSNDPIPAYSRGYYFTGTSSMFSSTNNIAPWFSMNFWVYPMGDGYFFTKFLTSPSVKLVSINFSSGFAYVKLTLSDSSTVLFTGSTPLMNSWHYLSVTGSVVAGKTVLSLYVDNSLDTSKSSTTFAYLYENGHTQIGGNSGGFQGYLWSFDLYNDETQSSASWNLNVGCGSGLSPSTSCPTCQNLEYPGSSSCTTCLSFCNKGCRDNRSCNLCKTSTCFDCTSFSGNCLSCITGAIPDGSGGCRCDHNLYWNITMQDCILCDIECYTCLDTTFFECSICYSNEFLVDNICLRECPYGFGSPCTKVATPVIAQKFNADLTGNNYGLFSVNLDASRLAFFILLDASDSVPVSQRGIFLSQLMYLTTGAGIYISHSYSIGCWMNPMVDGDTIRYMASNSYFIFNSNGNFQYVLMDTNTTAYKYAAYMTIADGWNYVSWTMQYLNGGTRVQLFLGGTVKADQYCPESIFRPAKSAALQLGYSWTWMTGFLYSFQMWNVAINDFSYYLNDNSCGTGLGITCLHAYTKSTYNDITSCGGSCSTDVTSGCARSVQCNQCYSTLCADCTGYGANYCTACVENASGWPGNCTCDQGYLIDNLYQCKGCSTGCTYCNSQAFNNCTACFPTYYLIEGVCNKDNCPSGYSKNSVTNACDIANILPFSVDFQDLIVLNTIDSLNIGSSSTNKYPNYDANDPWPAKNRGYYFSGTTAVSTTFMFGPIFTITIWIKALQAGVVLEKYTTAAKVLLGIDTDGIATLTLTLKKSSISAGSVTSILNNWCYLSVTNTFNKDGSNTLKLNINGVLKQTKKSGSDWLNDLPTGSFFIGADPTYSNGFTGFITRINIYIDDIYANSDYLTAGCNTGCTVCSSAKNCLSDCGINKYPDACTNCLNTCTKGCVRDLTCRLCKQSECLACESFSGDCTSCITNASLNSGSCSCNLNAFFDTPTQTCIICDNLCDDCLSTNYFECSTCDSSSTIINHICLRDCPYKFTLPNCDPVTDAVIDTIFYGTFQGSYGIFNTGAHSSTYQFWNSPEADDPIPALNRGLYFSSGSYLETNTDIYLFNSASMGIWVYTIISGDLIYKQNRLTLKSNGSLIVTLEDPTEVTTAYTTSALTMTGWNYLSFTISYSSISSTVSVYLNNILKNTANYPTLLFRDVVSKTIIIGKSTTTLFKGFVYEFTLWNSAVTDFSGKVNDLCGTSQGSACLWTCNINQYYYISGCSSCSSCTNGCRNSDSCNICYDPRCEICSDFELGSCTQCFIGANLEFGSCVCDENYYWNVNSGACEICDSKCSSCTSSEEYGCNGCKAGYVLLNGICMTFCPLGYTAISDICTLNSDYIFDLKFETLSGIIYDSKSFIPVLTGNSEDFYPNYDSYDPIAAYLRGVYFNGISSVLQLPPFLSYKSPKLSLSPWFTISVWINPEISFGTIFYKSNSLSIITQLVSITLSNYYPSILLRIQGTTISHKCENVVNHYSWSHLSFTINFDSTGNSIITCFVNTISDSSPGTISDYFIDDPNSLSVKIGAYEQSVGYYTNFFKGFIYWMQIYNSVKSISSLSLQSSQCTESCSSCPLAKSCIPNCRILEYWIGPSFSQCDSCSSDCSYSCKDSGSSCTLCYNNICELCQDYIKNSCTQCKQNASNETSCSCDAPYLWNPYYEYCQVISEGQFWGDDGEAYSCPIKCKYCKSKTSCITCVDNAKLANNNCTCITGYNGTYNCNLMTFEAYLEVDIDNSLYLTFSEELKFTLNYGDFLITIEGESNYKWIFEIQGADKYSISMNIDFSIIANTPIYLNFTNSSGIFSINDAVLTTHGLVGYLYKYDYTSPYIESISQQAKTSSQVAVSAVMVSSFVSMNPSSLWTMMNTIEILSFITLSSISITPALYAFLKSLNNYNIVPNFFADFIDQSEGIKPYKEAYNYGYETNLLLLNSGNIIETFLAIILCFPLVAFLSKCSQRWIGRRFTDALKDYKYSVFVRFWLQNYIEIGATALIGLLDFATGNGFLMFNVIICLILETLIVMTPFALLLFMIKNRKKIIHRSKAFLKTWDSLFYEFDIEKCHMSSQYYLLFIWRRIIYVLTLILLRDFPGLQGGILIAISALFALYVAVYRPHEDPVLMVSNIYSEIGVLVVCIHITFFVFDLSSSLETALEQSIYFWVGSIMVSNLIASLIIFFRTLYTILRPKIEKLLNIKKSSMKRIVPQTETEHSFEANTSLDNPHLFE
ncbi:unnamed protein product [Blepharisma stoltei]|uniref:EGF-like domain-containing protein n=1 Tax=Blepharisma stoltei TaxID=1481888 RepID=A0AAU9JSL8_9CILI|nr:unnamed protein product [Blepharisma stoltei]